MLKKDRVAKNALDVAEKIAHATDTESSFIEMMQVKIAGEMMLLLVSDVGEVVRYQKLSEVPMAPDHLLGVCNIHGQIVCVIDPCLVMHLAKHDNEVTESTRFVVLRHARMNLAIQVEEVPELLRVQQEDVPEFEKNAKGFFCGNMHIDGKDYRVIHAEALFE